MWLPSLDAIARAVGQPTRAEAFGEGASSLGWVELLRARSKVYLLCGSVISFLFVAITFIDYVVPCAIAADLDNAQGSRIAALFWLAPNTVLVGATVWTFKHQPLDGSTCC